MINPSQDPDYTDKALGILIWVVFIAVAVHLIGITGGDYDTTEITLILLSLGILSVSIIQARTSKRLKLLHESQSEDKTPEDSANDEEEVAENE